ncbi:helix-turn-helix domain-containing protein [Weissella cibaria]
MLKTIGQVINDVRREKHISLAQIADLGISKSRYYRVIDGEIDMPMFDIMTIMDALTLSFAELGQLTNKACLQDITLHWLLTVDRSELEARANGVDEQDTDFRRQIFAYSLALRADEVTPEQSEGIFQRLVTLEAFTIIDLVGFALIAPVISADKFKLLYVRYTAGMANNQNFLNSDLYDLILTIHMAAIDKLLLQPENRSYNSTMFVIETILNQYSEPQYMELRLLQQVMQLLKTTTDGVTFTTNNRMTTLLLSAKTQHASVIKTRLMTLDLSALWTEFQVGASNFWVKPNEHMRLPSFSTLPPEEMFDHYGDVFRWIIKQKHVTPGMVVDAGVSTYKLYKAYNENSYLQLEELLKLMHLLDLMPSDIDVVLRRRLINVTNSTWYQYSWQHIQPLGYDALARTMQLKYETDHQRKDLEAYFEFKALDGLFVRQNWFQSPAAAELSKAISDELMTMETWSYAEFRVARYAMLHIENPAGIQMWAQLLYRALKTIDQRYINRNTVLDIFEWPLLRAILRGKRELAETLLQVAQVADTNAADVMLFGRGQQRLFDIYADILHDKPHTCSARFTRAFK